MLILQAASSFFVVTLTLLYTDHIQPWNLLSKIEKDSSRLIFKHKSNLHCKDENPIG